MYHPGARIEIRTAIKFGEEVFQPGLQGTIVHDIPKMVAKAYKVNFDDGRAAEIHITTMNNQTYIFGPDGEKIDPKSLWRR